MIFKANQFLARGSASVLEKADPVDQAGHYIVYIFLENPKQYHKT